MDKNWLRQYIKTISQKISLIDKVQESKSIFDIRQKELLSKYNNRAVYLSLADEVDTKHIIKTILQSDKKCFLPIQQGDNFFFCEITEKTAYKINQYNIPEPINAKKSRHIPEAILVPGLAFTKEWKRLWRWLWRYDKLLAQHPNTTKIGLAYSRQLITNITTQAHDQDMDIILSTQLYFRP